MSPGPPLPLWNNGPLEQVRAVAQQRAATVAALRAGEGAVLEAQRREFEQIRAADGEAAEALAARAAALLPVVEVRRARRGASSKGKVGADDPGLTHAAAGRGGGRAARGATA